MKPISHGSVPVWIALLTLLLAGCHPTPVATPAPIVTDMLPATDSPVTTTPPSSQAETGGDPAEATPSWSLEPLSAENAGRITLLTHVGAGSFGDTLRVSPDGATLAVAAAGGVLLFDAASGKQVNFFSSASMPVGLAFSPDGRQLAVVHREPSGEVYTIAGFSGLDVPTPVLEVWDLESGELAYRRTLAGQGCGDYYAWDLSYSPDGGTLLFRDHYSLIGFGRSDNLCLVSALDGSLVRAIGIDLPWQSNTPALFSPDGRYLTVGLIDRENEGADPPPSRVRVYEVSSGSLVRELDGLGSLGGLATMAVSPDGQWLALAGSQGARLLSMSDGSLLATFEGQTGDTVALAFSPDGKSLALASTGGSASLWGLPAGDLLWQTAPRYSSPIVDITHGSASELCNLAFSPDGRVLYTLALAHFVYSSSRVSAWQVADGQELYSTYGRNSYSRPALSPDGSRLVVGGFDDGRAQVWSVAGDELLFELQGHTGMVLAAQYSPDGSRIATASLDGDVRLWDAASGASLATLSGHGGAVQALQFSPDGGRLATLGEDSILRLWNPRDGNLLGYLDTQAGGFQANSITFTLDGKSVWLAFGCAYVEFCPSGGNGDLRRVELENGQVETGLPYAVYNVTFSRDQSAFAVDGAQRPQAGRVSGGQAQVVASFSSPLGNGALSGAAITPDGSLFFSGNGFGLHVWSTASGEMLALDRGPASAYGTMWVTPDQKELVIAELTGLVDLWGVPAGQ